MARHTLKNAVAKLGSNVLDGLRQIDIEETVGDVDLTAAGDAWQDHDTGIPGWTASISFLLDHEAAANQSLRAGDVVAFEGYTEGDGSGKTYYSGTASVLSHKLGGSYDGEATREYSCKGKGALNTAVVV
ncbi:hypothetical protein K3722_07495 [Leisingera caerulea]|uniref:Uncharacterized protein n=1 Tax=Leisingera caerulea TaxID=506591 RepID=A0ABY5X120_LEICA|nr:hypothetical protein [Leisingera caerulea]UWQ59965.1 hypothetical protein K3722_07495 [Leisingera caerulea]